MTADGNENHTLPEWFLLHNVRTRDEVQKLNVPVAVIERSEKASECHHEKSGSTAGDMSDSSEKGNSDASPKSSSTSEKSSSEAKDEAEPSKKTEAKSAAKSDSSDDDDEQQESAKLKSSKVKAQHKAKSKSVATDSSKTKTVGIRTFDQKAQSSKDGNDHVAEKKPKPSGEEGSVDGTSKKEPESKSESAAEVKKEEKPEQNSEASISLTPKDDRVTFEISSKVYDEMKGAVSAALINGSKDGVLDQYKPTVMLRTQTWLDGMDFVVSRLAQDFDAATVSVDVMDLAELSRNFGAPENEFIKEEGCTCEQCMQNRGPRPRERTDPSRGAYYFFGAVCDSHNTDERTKRNRKAMLAVLKGPVQKVKSQGPSPHYPDDLDLLGHKGMDQEEKKRLRKERRLAKSKTKRDEKIEKEAKDEAEKAKRKAKHDERKAAREEAASQVPDDIESFFQLVAEDEIKELQDSSSESAQSDTASEVNSLDFADTTTTPCSELDTGSPVNEKADPTPEDDKLPKAEKKIDDVASNSEDAKPSPDTEDEKAEPVSEPVSELVSEPVSEPVSQSVAESDKDIKSEDATAASDEKPVPSAETPSAEAIKDESEEAADEASKKKSKRQKKKEKKEKKAAEGKQAENSEEKEEAEEEDTGAAAEESKSPLFFHIRDANGIYNGYKGHKVLRRICDRIVETRRGKQKVVLFVSIATKVKPFADGATKQRYVRTLVGADPCSSFRIPLPAALKEDAEPSEARRQLILQTNTDKLKRRLVHKLQKETQSRLLKPGTSWRFAPPGQKQDSDLDYLGDFLLSENTLERIAKQISGRTLPDKRTLNGQVLKGKELEEKTKESKPEESKKLTLADIAAVLKSSRESALASKDGDDEEQDDIDDAEEDFSDEDSEQRKKKKKDSPLDKLVKTVKEKCNEEETPLLDSIVDPEKLKSGYDDVIIDTETKAKMRQLIALSRFKPKGASKHLLSQIKINGAMFYGPPGTGKTHLARAIARDSGSNMLAVDSAAIESKWVGETEKNIRATFSLAVKLHPCVLFIDEVDSVFYRRRSDDKSWQRKALTQFLSEMDGLGTSDKAPFVVVATNRPEDLDDAFLRRLPHKVLFRLPDQDQRAQIFRGLIKDEDIEKEVTMDALASKTKGYSGSDIKSVVAQAALTWAVEEAEKQQVAALSNDKELEDSTVKLSMKHFEKAIQTNKATVTQRSLDAFEEFAARFNPDGSKEMSIMERMYL